MLNILQIKENDSAIHYAKELLARCENGEIVSILALEVRRGGSYKVMTTGNANRFETAGMCMEMASRILADDR